MKKFLRYFLAFVLITITLTAAIAIEPSIRITGFSDVDVTVLTKGENYVIECKDEVFCGQNAEYSEILTDTVNAFLAAEDKRFFDHEGVDYVRIASAALTDLKEKKFAQGGSTITQQLAKNVYLSSDKTLKRKLAEIRLARKIERKLSKKQILAAYLNNLYFGNGIYGIKNAAKAFFDKKLQQLSVKESAMLAAVINNPNYYSPYKKNNQNRAKTILRRMKNCGYIDDATYNVALAEQPKLTKNGSVTRYIGAVIAEAKEILGVSSETLKTSGYKIICNYNKEVSSFAAQLLSDEHKMRILVLGNDGKIIAYESNCDVGAFVKRSPASTIKPLACYAPMLENGKILPSTPVLDEKKDFGSYSPQNFNNSYNGWVSCKYALKESLNIPAVKLMESYGVENSKKFLKRFGIETEAEEGLALSLGGMKYGVSLPSIAAAYSVFANGGKYNRPAFVDEIQKNGVTVYKRKEEDAFVIKPTTAYYINEMLNECAAEGTAKVMEAKKFDVAAKTGTAGNEDINSDSYCIAYNKDYTVAVHILDSNTNGGGLPTYTAKLLLMSDINSNKSFDIPKNIQKVYINSEEYYKNHRLVKASAFDKPKDKILISADDDFVFEQKEYSLSDILSLNFDYFSRFYGFFD